MKPLSSLGSITVVLVLSVFLFMRFVFSDSERLPPGIKAPTHDAELSATVKGNYSASESPASEMSASHGIELFSHEHAGGAKPVDPESVLDGRDSTTAEPENFVADILQRAADDPTLPYQLLGNYLKIEDKAERLPLISALSALILFDENGAVIEQLILNRAVDPADANQARWADLLREVGVRTSPARQQVLDQLVLASEPLIAADLVHSILPVEASGEERLNVLAHLAPLVDHSNDSLRGAAIRQVAMWGGQEHIGMLENAMQDPSNEVRHAAAGAAMMSDLRSDAVKYSLIQMLGNDDEAQDTRLQAYYALDNYELTPTEQQTVAGWEVQATR